MEEELHAFDKTLQLNIAENTAQEKMYSKFLRHCEQVKHATSVFLNEISKHLDTTEKLHITNAVKCLRDISNCLLFTWETNDNGLNHISCIYGIQQHLSNGIKSFLVQYVKTLYKHLSGCKPQRFLKVYVKYWKQYSIILYNLNNLLETFDKYFAQSFECDWHADHHEELAGKMNEEALNVWERLVTKPLTSTLEKHLKNVIQKGQLTGDDQDLVRNAFESISQVSKQMYMCVLEEVLKERRVFYKEPVFKIFHDFGNSKYIEELANTLQEEKILLCKITGKALFQRMQQEYHVHILTDHLPLLHKCCYAAVTGEQWTDLVNLYTLLKPFHHEIEFLCQTFEEYIKDVIFSQLSDGCASPIHVIGDFHSECTKIVNQIFKDDIRFIAAMDRVCSQAVNSIENPIEVMSVRWDSLMQKGIAEQDIPETTKQYMNLVKYPENSKQLCVFFHKLLIRRLLRNTTRSMNAERAMVEMLTKNFGISNTYKLSIMLTDMSVSNDITVALKNDQDSNCSALCKNLSFQVLNSFAWPLNFVMTDMPFSIPRELIQPLDLFQNIYKQRFPQRKLTWVHERSSCEIELLFLRKPYFVLLESSYMASLLLLFDDQDSMSIQELQDKTHLPLNEIIKNLQALVDIKLLVVEASAALHHQSIVSLNLCFMNKRKKILVTTTRQRKSTQ